MKTTVQTLTPKQVYAIKGKLKGRKRYMSMATRHQQMMEKSDLDYQNKLAKEMLQHL